MATIDCLPDEILEHILCLVSPYRDLKACREVCWRWYNCCCGVAEKKKSRFLSALKMGHVDWYSPSYPSHIIPISRRYSHSAAVFESSMFVFGGCTTTNTTFNDLWRFDLGYQTWTRTLTTGTYPSPKAYTSMVLWNDCLILFGGWTHPPLYPLHQPWVLFNELHIYDIHANRWTQYYYSGCPPPSAGHSATIHGDCMVIFGGLQKQESTSSSCNDIFCLDLVRETWYKPVVSGTPPSPRYGQSQIKLDEHHILIIAGCGGSNKLYSDVWLLTLPEHMSEKWHWQQVLVDGSDNAPSQLCHNPACKVGGRVVVLSPMSVGNFSTAGQMSQLLVPSSVRRHGSNMWAPPGHEVRENPPLVDNRVPRDDEPYVNGRRGLLREPQKVDADSVSNEKDPQPLLGISPHQGRIHPSIRPNASSNPEMRLQALYKMEQKLRERTISTEKAKPGMSKADNGAVCSAHKGLIPHLLDITPVITEGKAAWLPVNLNGMTCGVPPQPTLLYSLVLGRGHLAMFGGIAKDPAENRRVDSTSNAVTFISVPSSLYGTL